MIIRRVTSAGLALLICASGQITKAQEPEITADEPIDEITVVGEKSTLKLKYEYELAEDNF